VNEEQAIPELQFEKYRLDNGLEVILLEDHRLPLVAVNIWYHVGPANERPGLTGFAHLFEHMMFQGSKHLRDDQHFRLLEAAGASEINGTTDFDRTNYFETLPSDQLELALWLESDRMGFLLETLDSPKLENQRDVVRNERRQSVENQPYGLVEEALFHNLFPEDHPYHASVIGSHADIEAARLADVRDFFRLYYAPNNASLAIVGDIVKEETRVLVEKYFGPIRSGRPVPAVDIRTPQIRSERRVVVGDRVELPRIYLAWITPPIYAVGDAECDLLAKILGGGKSSRLYKRLVYERRIAQDIVAHQFSLSLGSIFTIQATAKPGVSPEILEAAIDGEIETLRREGPSETELDRARNTFESGIIRGLETLGGFGGVADRLNQYNHFLGDPAYLAEDIRRYREATSAGLQKMAREFLTRDSRVVIHGVPGEKVIHDVPRQDARQDAALESLAPEIADQDWRYQPPARGQSSDLQLPVPQVHRLDNGLTIYLVEQHTLPIVAANLITLTGSEANPVDLPGLASFTADMLDEGSSRRSALQIAEDADQLGATVSSGSSMDMSYVALRTLRRNLESAFEIFSDVALNPVFPDKEIDRIRHERVTRILQLRDNPGAVAAAVFAQSLYGPRNPYGYTELGTEPSNQAIRRAEMFRFWQQGFAAGNSALVLAGDLAPDAALRLAEAYFGRWAGHGIPQVTPGTPDEMGRRIVIVDKPGSPQTQLRIGHVGIPRAHPDFIPVDVMNTALGGLFSSRINMNLRERNGYTYGAASAFSFRRGPGPFLVSTSVRTDVTAPAIREIMTEIERMRDTPMLQAELGTAIDSISRSLPGSFETNPQTASSVGQLFVYSLAPDYYRTFPIAVERVTVEEVQRVAREHLRPEILLVVAVGDRAAIEPQIESLRLGPIEIATEERFSVSSPGGDATLTGLGSF